MLCRQSWLSAFLTKTEGFFLVLVMLNISLRESRRVSSYGVWLFAGEEIMGGFVRMLRGNSFSMSASFDGISCSSWRDSESNE